MAESWRAALRLLEDRSAVAPAVLAAALETLPDGAAAACSGISAFSHVVATGAGSSAGHARFFASVLGELGVPASFVPLGAFLVGDRGSSTSGAALAVFSQGFSPNARIALQGRSADEVVWLVTTTPERSETGTSPGRAASPRPEPDLDGPDDAPARQRRDVLGERIRAVGKVASEGVRVLRCPGGEEYGTLLRVVGPLVGYAAALALARAVAAARGTRGAPARGLEPAWVEVSRDRIVEAVAAAPSRVAAELGSIGASAAEGGLVLLATGAHRERVDNLALKVLEGALRPLPPIWDPIDIAHGPFQEMHGREVTLLALTRSDAQREGWLLDRVEAMLVPARHRLVRLRAELPGPLAVLEHEMMVNALVLRWVRELRIDQAAWPGFGGDASVYEIDGSEPSRAPDRQSGRRAGSLEHTPESQGGARGQGSVADVAAQARTTTIRDRLLEASTWPEAEAFFARSRPLAILPLGSTEQHGPHLPLATDTVIARAVAERLASRFDDAVVLPPLALGCAEEHMAFAGTLSLAPETLAAILRDVAAALERHGCARLFVFTAHGGNRVALERALSGLRAGAPRLAIACAASLPQSLLHAVSARLGVTPAAAGHHAGELETSIMSALDPGAVRRERLAPGLLVELSVAGAADINTYRDTDVAGRDDTAAIFYPSLRRNAPDGTVGDPRAADPARADAYLDAWVDWLAALVRDDASWK